MPRKILCFLPYARYRIHIAAFCDLMQGLSEAGDELYLMTCERSVNRCADNADGNLRTCRECEAFQISEEAWLDAQGVNYRKVRAADFIPDPAQARDFRRQHEGWADEAALRNIVYRNFDVGRAALGTLVTNQRDCNPDIGKHRALLDDVIENGVRLFDATQNIIRQFGIDKAYIFNGRLAEVRACLKAVEDLGKPWCMQEIGTEHYKYSLYENSSSHDLAFHAAQIARQHADLLAGTVTEERIAAARHWFVRRQKGGVIDGRDMLKHQQAGALPEGYGRYQRTISFFLGSRDEYVCLPGWDLKLHATQEAAVRELALRARDDAGLHFYVRVHPNLAGVNNAQIRDIEALAELPNVTVISPTSAVSSYALVLHSDLNIVFGSTVGIEALFLRRPAILLGPAYYQELPGFIVPASHEELHLRVDEFRNGRTLTEAEAQTGYDSALAYGLFVTTFGEPYRRFGVDEHQVVTSRAGVPWERRPYQLGAMRSLQRLVQEPAWEIRRARIMKKLERRRLRPTPG